MISIISILLTMQSICTDFQNFGHKIEYVELVGIRFDPCKLNEDQKKLFELKHILKADSIYKITYKTDLAEGYLLTKIGGIE